MKWLNYVLLLLFFALIFSISFTSSNDFTQDLGRHLKLGEIIVQTHQVPKTNLFSYTFPAFPFINHHWLSEVIFYGISSLFSLSALIVLKTILIVLAVGIMVKTSLKKTSLLTTLTIAFLLSPLLIERADIRPELFGYVLFAYLIYLLLEDTPPMVCLYSLPVLMLLWINFHITFIFGFLLLGLILIKLLLNKNIRQKNISIGIIGISFITPIINPNGIAGLLYPLQIFGNYGYTIVENQNLFFLHSVIFNPLITYFFALTPVVILALAVLLINKKFWHSAIVFIFTLLAFYQIRHLPFFVLAALPSISLAIHLLIQKISINKGMQLINRLIYLTIICLAIIFITSNTYYQLFDNNKTFGMKVNDDIRNASQFLLKNKLPAPIFNNFDIGGYAIYSLYPQYKVFVDNRPEAYPANFLQNVYIKLQENAKLQNKIFQQYHIQTIYFAHSDQTPWGEAFLQRLLADHSWNIVYLDSTMIIATKAHLKDIRNNGSYFSQLIQQESNYLHLLRLTRLFALMKKNALASQAFAKANDLNPSSCTAKRILYYQRQNTPYFYQADELKRQNWFCF